MKRFLTRFFLASLFLTLFVPFSPAAGGTVLSEARIREVIIGHLRQKLEGSGMEMKIKRIAYNGDILVPAGEISYEVVSPQSWEGWGNSSLALIIRVDDRVVKNIPVKVDVEAIADMVVAVRPLEAGDVIGEGDVAVQKKEVFAGSARVCRSLNDVVGKRMRVGVRHNGPIRADQIEKIPLVKSGQLVTIVVENDMVRVAATGSARGTGGAGDQVVVQNQETRKDIPARVVDSNTVKVEF